MDKMAQKLLILLALLIFPLSLAAADLQIDLNGFRLLQPKKAVDIYFGEPLETLKTEHSIVKAYQIDSNAYMVFEYKNDLPDYIYSIQLTGTTVKAMPFKGLMLGDDISKINNILGQPSVIKKTDLPNISQYNYDGTNYVAEVDDKDKLYSIKILARPDMIQKADDSFKSYDVFKKLIIAKDIKGIIEMLRPDVEIYKNGKALFIQQRYVDFVASPDKEILEALLGETHSVLKEVKESEPEGEIRVIINFGVGEVYKFHKGKILKEIVFFPYDGKTRVYEIQFRENKN